MLERLKELKDVVDARTAENNKSVKEILTKIDKSSFESEEEVDEAHALKKVLVSRVKSDNELSKHLAAAIHFEMVRD